MMRRTELLSSVPPVFRSLLRPKSHGRGTLAGQSIFVSVPPLRILSVIGSNTANSVLHGVVLELGQRLEAAGCSVDVLDLHREPLGLLDPTRSYTESTYLQLKPRFEAADGYVFATPDYHGSMSGTLKNALDHFWKEFAGKLFVPMVSSYEKGLTAIDQIRTVARQCYAWALPYGFSMSPKTDLADGRASPEFVQRMDMLCHDIVTYGTLLARQREADLVGTRPGFMAKYRSPAAART
jgi:NAD(P)H-dependent FMN reductase